jgi:hypothetical protein
MSDLVQRLRTAADKADKIFDTSFGNPWREAAAEIERLREAIVMADNRLEVADCPLCVDVARSYLQAALEQSSQPESNRGGAPITLRDGAEGNAKPSGEQGASAQVITNGPTCHPGAFWICTDLTTAGISLAVCSVCKQPARR